MNRRLLTSLIGLLYVSVAVVFGVLHHHKTTTVAGHDDDCVACQWQLQASSDIPIAVVAPVVHKTVFQTLIIPASAPAALLFFTPTASRAPPIASA
jgi:hypothetical protein